MIKHRNITEVQDKFLSSYLEKSKETLEEFLEGTNRGRQIAEFKDLGWIEYSKHDNVLWIHTAYSCKPHKETVRIWNNLKQLAKDSECDRIQFTTLRNPKAFKRLFGAKIIEYKMEVLL